MKIMENRLLAALLAFCLTLALLPGTALAANESGTCGRRATWTLDSAGTLTIKGSGKMFNYGFSYSKSDVPWWNSRKGIKKAVIQKGITSVGDFAFPECSSLTSVTIPSGVNEIGCDAFMECSSLTGVTIPSGVTDIGSDAFYGCSSLKSVTIPSSVTSIGWYAFKGCSSLSSVTLPTGITYIEEGTFKDCSKLASVSIPASVKDIDYNAFYGCTALSNVYYSGTRSQWDDIKIGSGNVRLTNATIHYNSTGTGATTVPSAPKISLTTSTTIAAGTTTKVTWSAVPGADRYLINVKTKGTYLSKDDPVTTGKCEQPLEFATPGEYEIWLKAENAKGKSAESNHIVLTVTNKTMTVTFDPNSGTVTTKSKSVTNGGTYGTLPTPTRSGYKFDGWYTTKTGGTKITSATKVTKTANHTVYAHWSKRNFTVTLNANGGTLLTDTIVATLGTRYRSLPTPTRAGYHFNGWYTAKTGGTKVTAATKATSVKTLYARWGTATPTVKTRQSGFSWRIVIPEDYKVLLYSNETTAAVAKTAAEQSGEYVVTCTKMVKLSNDTVRYYGKFSKVSNTTSYWFTYSDEMYID